MTAVFRREFKSFFTRLSSYIFLALFLATVGLFMLLYNFYYGNTGFEYPLSMIGVSFALLLPIVTVGIFAKERASGIGRFLGMLPITSREIVLGKFLSLVAILSLMTLALAIAPFLLSAYGEVDLARSFGALVAFFLMALAWLSIEVFLSLRIRRTPILWVVSYAFPLAMIALGYLARLLPSALAEAVDYLSIFGAYTPFLYGLLDWRSIVVWGSVTAVFFVWTLTSSDCVFRKEAVR